MGPLIREAQRAKVEGMIDRARLDGAQVAYGGGRPANLDKGYFVEPTLLVDVDNEMEIARQEVFGPVGVVIPFDDDDDAVRLANDSDFGLGGGVWSADPVRAYAIARRLRTGTVSVNGGGGSAQSGRAVRRLQTQRAGPRMGFLWHGRVPRAQGDHLAGSRRLT